MVTVDLGSKESAFSHKELYSIFFNEAALVTQSRKEASALAMEALLHFMYHNTVRRSRKSIHM